jgi:hypothetical protein
MNVYDEKDFAGLRLQQNVQIAERYSVPDGAAIEISTGNIARAFAEKIVRNRELFKIDSQHGYTNIRGDAIVLTPTELANLMQSQFRKGIDHANYFSPIGYGSKEQP